MTHLLRDITGPVDLRRLTDRELGAVAAEIRRVIVAAVSANGGHLGSNLGAVELTLALHRVFESPAEPILWDTGHQAYVHKLVTGRHDGFARLRQRGGLSGYPSRRESGHDLVENSHASTALSYAHGLATARRLSGQRRPVVAVVGDGALTGGLAFEALSNLGMSTLPVVVAFNDNGRSYAPTQSRLSTARWGDGSTASAFFQALGLAYLGPVDGHDVAAVERLLRRASAVAMHGDGPAVAHVITQKGRGYPPAEEDGEKCLHDLGPFDPTTGVPDSRPGERYTDAFTATLLVEASRRPEVVAITAAMPGSTGLLPFAARFPDRFFDVGIAEQHAVTMAAGLAMGGLRPVVAIYAAFLNRAWDQLYYDVGLHHLPVVFCVDRAGITGDDGPSHHGVLDLALLSKIPGMVVLAPSSYEEVGTMLRVALNHLAGPVALRWPKTPARRAPAGRGLAASQLRAGTDVCLAAVGGLVSACQEAAELLAGRGVDATVWDLRAVTPLDPSVVADALEHPAVVTVEDGVVEGGAGALLTAALHRAAVREGRRVPHVIVHGVPVAYIGHGRPAEILADLGLDGPGIAATALRALAGVSAPAPV